MRVSKTALLVGLMATAVAAGGLAASVATADSTTYVVCNRYDECWKVHQKYDRYPADEHIIFRDDAWYDAHQHDAHIHWLNDPANDAGYYDRDGAWVAFPDAPAGDPHP